MKLLRPTHPFIPMSCGFLYLVAIIDWASRAVLAWRLSNTNNASFCAAALEEALLRFTFIEDQKVFSSDVLYKLRCDLAIVKNILTC